MKQANTTSEERALGHLRIFQAIVNDLKLKHEEVTLEDGRKVWAYTYEGIDPYELEDNHFPSIQAAIAEARKEGELIGISKLSLQLKLAYIGDQEFVADLEREAAELESLTTNKEESA